jgi:hypothetical protein
MIQQIVLKKLEVTRVQLETTAGISRPTAHPNRQIRLSVISEPVSGNQVGGEIVFFESEKRGSRH